MFSLGSNLVLCLVLPWGLKLRVINCLEIPLIEKVFITKYLMYNICLDILANSVTFPRDPSPIFLHCLLSQLCSLESKAQENSLGPLVAEPVGHSRLNDKEDALSSWTLS